LDSAVVEIECFHSGVVSNQLLGGMRIPVSEHKDMSYDYAVQHWFPLINGKARKKDGGVGELGLKIGAVGGNVRNPLQDRARE
jgi:hypothetical protein